MSRSGHRGRRTPFAMGNFFLYGNPFVAPSANFQSRAWSPASLMQSRGESNTPALYAMTDALAYFDQLGIEAIYQRGVDLGNHLKGLIADRWGASALWVQQNPDPRFATALTSFNPFAAKDSSADYNSMRNAINAVVSALAAETPKIYIRSITWRSNQLAPTADRVGFRISTHGVYTSFADIDHVFARLVHHLDQSGLVQL